MQPKLAPERILPINGQYDAIVTPDKARRLFEAWKIPEVVWLPVGHFGVVHTRLFRRAVRDFVERWIREGRRTEDAAPTHKSENLTSPLGDDIM